MSNTKTTNTSTVAQWLPSIVPLLILAGSMMGGYFNLESNIKVLNTSQANYAAKITELDKYDRFLQRQVEKQERRLLVVETKQVEIRDTQVRLETKLDRILNELVALGTSITELKTIQEQADK